MALNQRVAGPYGDIFQAGTPALDKLQVQLYSEQKQREAERQSQLKQANDDFAKNLALVKTSDIPELTDKYNTWKTASQAAMKNPSEVTPQQQLDILKKKADVYRTIDASKQAKQEDEAILKGATSPNGADMYADNVFDLLAKRRNTPTSQLATYKDEKGNVVDLSNMDTFRYKGDNFDFLNAIKNAKGTPKQIFTSEEPVGGDNLQTKMTPYFFGNSPLDYKNNLLAGLHTHKGERFAANAWDNIPQETKDAVDAQFNALPSTKWKQMTNAETPQNLSPSIPDSKADQFTSYMAKLYAINEQPEQRTPQFRTNESEKLKRQQQQQIQLEGIRQKGRKELVDYREQAKAGGEAANEVWIDSYINQLTKDAQNSTTHIDYTHDGKTVQERSLDVDPVAIKALTKGKEVPGDITITPDGKYRPIYYQHDANGARILNKDGSGYKVNMELSVPISQQQFKLALGSKAVTPGQRTKEMLHNPPVTQPEMPSGSKSEFKAAGWTDDQINKALKAGKIKLK